MASNLARISPSNGNIIALDRIRPGLSGRASGDRNLCHDLCPDFSKGSAPRKAKESRKKELTPALIDDLRAGKLDDSKTGALSIEVLSSGKKRWLYRRRIAGRGDIVKLSLGLYPAYSIADAREWANGLNLQMDAGIDPRETSRQELRLATMTVERAHELCMEAVREGRSSRAKRSNKPRTVADKQDICRRDIAPKLGRKIIYDVTETDLIKLVEAKGKTARVRANRLAAELKVFFGWTASLRGLEVGLELDPSRRLGDLRFPETPRSRRLALQEIAWFLEALVGEERDYQRGMLLWLLTAARLAEECEAHSDELSDGIWTIPASRTKNSLEHRIALGSWGWSLMQTDCDWVFPAPKLDGPRSRNCWYRARSRVRERMSSSPAGRSSALRRTIFDGPAAPIRSGSRSISKRPRRCSTTSRRGFG